MINFLKHKEIDKVKWDLCITRSVNSLIYPYSWYLDIASPGWDALVYDDYQAVFPLTHRTKIFHYLYQPFFTQQLGLFSPDVKLLQMTNDFLDLIHHKFSYADIQLNEQNEVNHTAVKIKKRKNFLLDLNAPIEILQQGFNSHTSRNIKKSEKKELNIQSLDADVAVSFYMTHKADVTSRVERSDYERLKQLLHAVNDHGMLWCKGAYNKQGELLASAVLYVTPGRLFLINNCVSPEGKETRAMYFLMQHIIGHFAGQPMLLDFEGSDREGIASFNKGFGAMKHTYPRVKINRLPWPIRWLKR